MESTLMRLNAIAKYARAGFIASFVLLFLGACATPSKQTSVPRTTVEKTDTQIAEPTSKLAQLAIKYANVSASQNPQRNANLLALANNEIEANNCARAEIILKAIEPSLIESANQSVSYLYKIECTLNKISSNQAFASNNNDYKDASLASASGASNTSLADLQYASSIELLDTWQGRAEARVLTPMQAERLTLARAQIAALQNNYDLAIKQLLTLSNSNNTDSLSTISKQQKNDLLWRWYSRLNAQQQLSLSRQDPLINDISTLFSMIQDSSINDTVRQSSIKQWLAQKSSASISTHLPQQLKRYLALERSKQGQIAVLLPLSGRLSSQGEAIKQGMLSAYLREVSESANNISKPSNQLVFIDTGSNTEMPTSVNAELLASFDMIIGPLLKSHVARIDSFALPQLKQVVLNKAESDSQASVSSDNSNHGNVSTLSNFEVSSENASITAYFALSPEQEAEQLVLLMRKRNITSPILIRDNSTVSNRMASAFIQAWENTEPTIKKANTNTQRKTNIQEITFTSNKSMRVGITSALDVLQSQQRIKQLENLSQERVYSVTRNRRDIDAFVVFSRPDELELINPIIESSISLFTNEQLPVFASSYSYDHKQSKNSQRDLRNLVFVDMPWLIENSNGNKRNDELSKQVDELFNQPPSAFLRLFAFGYDALAVADNLAQLSIFDHMKIDGLSGTLSLDGSLELNRELAWFAITEGSN
jgi:outer membrane PBP1 activator LpoA protein